MIDRLIEISLRNRFLVVALWIGVAGWGLWAMLHAPIDAIPDLSDNQVIVFTDWSGRSPQVSNATLFAIRSAIFATEAKFVMIACD
jgi:Cu(I)/Ag(I) efflux system membrane protein CusA/SilA